MRKQTFFFKNESVSGVLHNMIGSSDYFDLFSFNATSFVTNGDPINAFNFSNQKYWLGDESDEPNRLWFCFKYFSILPIGYKIKTSHYTTDDKARPKIWGFSGSNDCKNWLEYDEKNYSLKPSEAYYVEWKPGIPFRCFQLTTIETISERYKNRADIAEIDIYGSVIYNRMFTNYFFLQTYQNHFLYIFFVYFYYN